MGRKVGKTYSETDQLFEADGQIFFCAMGNPRNLVHAAERVEYFVENTSKDLGVVSTSGVVDAFCIDIEYLFPNEDGIAEPYFIHDAYGIAMCRMHPEALQYYIHVGKLTTEHYVSNREADKLFYSYFNHSQHLETHNPFPNPTE